MTPEQRAEKLWEDRHGICGGHFGYLKDSECSSGCMIIEMEDFKIIIAAAIRDAVEEAHVSGAHAEMEAHRLGIIEGKAEAYEECARFAEDHNGCVDVECLTKSNCGATIERKIRSRAKEAR